MTTANFYILANTLRPDQGLQEQNRFGTGQPALTGTKTKTEPETRLWKVCAAAVSQRFSIFEWGAFLLFGAVSLGALACCFSELVQLLGSGALDRTVDALLTR